MGLQTAQPERGGCTVKTLRTPQHIALIDELKRVRQNAGLTQTVLAGRLGVAQSFVAKVEGAERRLDVIELIKWLEAAEAFDDGAAILARVRAAKQG